MAGPAGQHLLRLCSLLCVPLTSLAAHAEMGAPLFQSGMCFECYKQYIENTGGQAQGHNPPAYTQGLIKQAKASQV